MIRRSVVSGAALLCSILVLPLGLSAQSVFVLGGAAVPTGDYGDFADVGWMVSGGVTFDVGEGGLFAGVEGLYSRSGTELEDVSSKPYSAMGFLGYDLPTGGAVTPYLYAGAGIQGVTVSAAGESDSESAFGYQFGAGLSFGTSGNVSPLVEVRYQGSGDEDVDLNFVGIAGGVSIGLGS